MFYSLPSNRLFALDTLTEFFDRTMLSHASPPESQAQGSRKTQHFGRVRTREALGTAGIWNMTVKSNLQFRSKARTIIGSSLFHSWTLRGVCASGVGTGLGQLTRPDAARVAKKCLQIPDGPDKCHLVANPPNDQSA